MHRYDGRQVTYAILLSGHSSTGTSTDSASNRGASGGAGSESLCAEVLSGRIKVAGPLYCFGEGVSPQATPNGSANVVLPPSYVNSLTPGVALSTQPGITDAAGGIPTVEISPVVGADTFADAGRNSQDGSCNNLNSSMEALINSSSSGGSSPIGQCMLGSTDGPTQSESAGSDTGTQAPLLQNVASTVLAEEPPVPSDASESSPAVTIG
jgi:hypothetical protein